MNESITFHLPDPPPPLYSVLYIFRFVLLVVLFFFGKSYMLREEEFCMQTDSHMDVVQDWDVKMLAMWGRVNNEYGILTTYVHKIEQLNQGAENKKEVPHLCQV